MKTLPFIQPATGEQFGQVDVTSPDEVQQAMGELRGRAAHWANTPLRERIRILRKLQKVVIDYTDEITEVVSKDNGKSRQDALIEVFMVVDRLATSLRHAPRWLRRHRVSPGLYFFRRYYTEPRPFGVVAVIGPWNYPFDLGLPPVMLALLAGNVVLFKPSEVTPAVGVLIEKLLRSVPELAPYVKVLHGDAETGQALVASQPDLIFLTGSTATGRKIAQAAAETLTPTLFELGGKDPMLVLEDADLKAAARWGVWGGFFNAGQTCISIERVYVVASAYDAFMNELLTAAKKVKVGYSPERKSPYHFGPLTFARQLEIVKVHLADAVEKGARILLGGRHDGLFMEPTIVVDVDHSMKIMREETFGPVIPVMKVRDEGEAIRLANDSDFGLSATIWSRDVSRAEAIAKSLQVGTVNINDALSHYAVPELPFGGVKQSGNARTHGENDLLQFTQLRSTALGAPPKLFDVATQLRLPGRYHLGKMVLQLVFGVTPQQKLAPFSEGMGQREKRQRGKRAAVGIALTSAVMAILLGELRFRRRRN